ncbi:MAG: PIN domain-containing protein [Immundisolibacterales bacterium]|nr:PIN domain-containing protein [Immundisolibacterales bacterium]
MSSFVDTNVLLYAVSTAGDEANKRKVARDILERDDLVLSVQVLQEFYAQATRPTKPDRLEHEPATALIESWLRFRVMETTVALVQSALASALRWRISYWDAAIVEAARFGGCPTLLSEDLQSGMSFAGVTVVNPFAAQGAG